VVPIGLCLIGSALGHDIPNARVDRSIQVTIGPGELEIDYEVSLSELTLTQDLRALVGTLPGGDPAAWFDRYGRETGPLNARGFLISVNGAALHLTVVGFDLAVEEHPRYVFHFRAPIPESGHLRLRDINYASSEGTSRLAIRGRNGVEVRADDRPADVTEIPIRPLWQLSDAEERRTKEVEADFRPARSLGVEPSPSVPPAMSSRQDSPGSRDAGRLVLLLDRSRNVSPWVLWLLAVGLGVSHAVQPGHGKTLVAAAMLGHQGNRWRGVVLALITTLTHFASVLAVAAVLWATRSTRYEELNRSLTHLAGFLIAVIGLWKLGRLASGKPVHDEHGPSVTADRGLLGLGIAGGIVPCWDAITLVILAEALGRLPLALELLLGFSLGMAGVLVAVSWVAGRFGGLIGGATAGEWPRRLGIAGTLVVTAIGLYLYAS
jgi:ABC-type nickel/cobalt efflux system permease component RcnA